MVQCWSRFVRISQYYSYIRDIRWPESNLAGNLLALKGYLILLANLRQGGSHQPLCYASISILHGVEQGTHVLVRLLHSMLDLVISHSTQTIASLGLAFNSLCWCGLVHQCGDFCFSAFATLFASTLLSGSLDDFLHFLCRF